MDYPEEEENEEPEEELQYSVKEYVLENANIEHSASRLDHSASLLEQKIYLFGGTINLERGENTNELLIFDTVKSTLRMPEIKGTPPCPRRLHGSAFWRKNLFVFGGWEGV